MRHGEKEVVDTKRKPVIREVIVVEGRYDRNALSQVVDALIFETGGFSVLQDREKLQALRMLAEKRGLILLTDSDDAGFVIRNRLKSLFPPEQIRQAFIPRIEGKEKRKQKPSKQGILGVEGMPPEVLLTALRNAGATEEAPGSKQTVTTADFYALGLSGKPGSAELRTRLAESLNLPAGISQADLRKCVSILLTEEELQTLVSRLTSE
jgi:ribonuclease M5